MLNDTTDVMTELAPKRPKFVEIIEMMHWPNIPFHKNRKVKFPILQTIMVIICWDKLLLNIVLVEEQLLTMLLRDIIIDYVNQTNTLSF